jgi:GNAT superfamily N-acetyltransferase
MARGDDPELRIGWCPLEAAPVVLALTHVAFAPQAALDPPSGAVSETLDDVQADLVAGRGVLAWRGDRAVAAARVLFEPGHLYVRRVAVHPDEHRRGVATAVMRWIHEAAPALGYAEIRLGVRTPLVSNRELYRKLGYVDVVDHGFWTEMRLTLG